ncbi:MAG: hypothetical protein AMXMBFR4_34390 [Candidatus Hydrogenedentota bacterium]
MRLSLVIPAFNEAARITATLKRVLEYLARQPYTSEVIVVDDGSADNTAEVARLAGPNIRVVSYRPNRGKGFAVRTGMMEGQGEIRLFYDADGSTPIEEIEKLWPEFDAGADIVIGSRMLPQSDVQIHQRWTRESAGRFFNLVLRMLGITRLTDTQCGFKAFTSKACDIVFPRQTIERFSFDAELLYIAQRHNLRIAEIPVRWINDPDSRVHPVKDSIPILRDILHIWRYGRKGRYD